MAQCQLFKRDFITLMDIEPRTPNDGEMDKIYPMPLNKLYGENKKSKIRECSLGSIKQNENSINILVIGATGSGKSSAINALFNYLTGVEYDDDFRLQLVDLEEDEKYQSQDPTQSQTQWVTVYKVGKFPGGKSKFQVNIVDTPGLGDTQGAEKNLQILDQLKNLFENHLFNVHAVCITLSGKINRLTAEQIKVFDHIKQIFGKDVVNNTFIWATFTSDDDPQIVPCLIKSGIQYAKLFPFDNGQLFKKIPESEKKRRRCKENFEDVYEFFETFLARIETITPISLEKTRRVMSERETLKETLATIKKKVTEIFKALDHKEQYKKKTERVETNEIGVSDVTFKVTVVHQDEDRTVPVLNCEVCKKTCCHACDHSFFKRGFQICAIMTSDSYCKKCRCIDSQHQKSKINRYQVEELSLIEIDKKQSRNPNFVFVDEIVKRDIADLRKSLSKNEVKKEEVEKMKKKISDDIIRLKIELYDNLKKLHDGIKSLNAIALFQEKSTLVDFLNEMKENDENKDEPGRASLYKELEEQAKQIMKY